MNPWNSCWRSAAILGLALIISPVAKAQLQGTLPAPVSAEEKMSYAIALEIGRRFSAQAIDLNESMALQGFRDALQGRSAIPEDELKRILGGLQAQARQRSVLDRRIASLKKLRAAENALALNASAPGVQVLESGIQIRRMVPGTETAPISRSTMLGYVLRLLDGREIERIEAVAHDAAPLPPGLREVLALMPQGARWMVWLPPQWAYGAAGRPPMIDGNEAVVVEITRIPDSPS